MEESEDTTAFHISGHYFELIIMWSQASQAHNARSHYFNSVFCCRDEFVFHNKEKAKENKFWFDSFLLVVSAKYVGDSSTDKATYDDII